MGPSLFQPITGLNFNVPFENRTPNNVPHLTLAYYRLKNMFQPIRGQDKKDSKLRPIGTDMYCTTIVAQTSLVTLILCPSHPAKSTTFNIEPNFRYKIYLFGTKFFQRTGYAYCCLSISFNQKIDEHIVQRKEFSLWLISILSFFSFFFRQKQIWPRKPKYKPYWPLFKGKF